MAIIDTLARAQNGAFFGNAGNAAGLSASVAEDVMGKLCPAIARDLKDKAQKDPEAFENLLELLEEGGDLDDVEATTGAEALADGDAILDDLYGSAAAAHKTFGRLVSDVTGDSLARIGAISACCVLTSLAAVNSASLVSSDAATAADTGQSGGGFFSVLFAAIFKAFLQSAQRQIAPKRRRRRSYTSYFGRRRTTPRKRRRTTTPSLDTIFRDILTKR